ncbi:MAG: hypothetical protein NT098_04250 [Candidatus Parcubacteria bacterium]|nr:hypothetical protein [Candidatus Parcubacteria bacterium]
MRKAVVIATRSRRGIPLRWNERCQHKHNSNHVDECTVDRRIHNKIARNKTKNQIRAFHGDWEDFVPVFIPKPYLD